MADSRITTTDTGQYDMLLAISQDSVNEALANMWDVDSKGLTDITVDGAAVDMTCSLSGKVKAPDMQVLADGTGSAFVLFRLNFESGKFNVFDKTVKKLVGKDMAGFRIAFQVSLGLKNIHVEIDGLKTKLKDSNLTPDQKKELEDQLKVKQDELDSFGSQAGDFSIQRLFVNMASADISSFIKSELFLPGLNDVQVTTFGTLINLWLTENKTEKNTTLGFSLAVNPDKTQNYKVADCLMPTSVNLQTYQYKATPTADPVLGWSGLSARNCVVYCNTTEKRLVSGDRYLRWSGNFTTDDFDKERRIDGTAIIKRELFLDRFVVPLLRQYNDDLQLVATSMELLRDGDAGDRRYHWRYECLLGYNPQVPEWTNDYFNFTRNNPGAGLPGLANRRFSDKARQDGFDLFTTAEGVSWSWNRSCNPGHKSNNQDWIGFLHGGSDPMNWADHFSGEIRSDSCVHVVPIPGQGIIKIRGYTECTVGIDGEYERLGKPNYKYTGRVGVFAHWQVNIVCSSSETDGMRCKFANQKVYKYFENDVQGIPAGENMSDAFVNTLSDHLEQMLTKKDSIAQAINDALSATGKFSHPATGSFDLKDPCFNKRGDLMVTASYKAPVKGAITVGRDLPEQGKGPQQRAANDIGLNFTAKGDVTAPLPGKKGG